SPGVGLRRVGSAHHVTGLSRAGFRGGRSPPYRDRLARQHQKPDMSLNGLYQFVFRLSVAVELRVRRPEAYFAAALNPGAATMVRTGLPSAAFQRRTSPSQLPEAMVLPSGETANA